MINFSRIEENLFLGSTPTNSVDVGRLKSINISVVLSLQSDLDFRTHRINKKKLETTYQQNNIECQRYPILDFDEQDLARRLTQPVQALDALLTAGKRVYVHCNAGVCRAPATVLTYLCHYRGMSLEAGLKYIREQRPQANPYLSAVQHALNQLAD